MIARDIYVQETGRESHYQHGRPKQEYIEWLERIVERTAEMLRVTEPSNRSVYDHDDLEELAELFKRIS